MRKLLILFLLIPSFSFANEEKARELYVKTSFEFKKNGCDLITLSIERILSFGDYDKETLKCFELYNKDVYPNLTLILEKYPSSEVAYNLIGSNQYFDITEIIKDHIKKQYQGSIEASKILDELGIEVGKSFDVEKLFKNMEEEYKFTIVDEAITKKDMEKIKIFMKECSDSLIYPMASDIEISNIKLNVQFNKEGRIISTEILDNYYTDSYEVKFVNQFKDKIKNCDQKLNIESSKYTKWKNINFTFDMN